MGSRIAKVGLLACVLVLAFSLSGCGSAQKAPREQPEQAAPKEISLYGTWEVSYLEDPNNGSKYTVEEIKDLGGFDFSEFFIILKEGNGESGSCYLHSSKDSKGVSEYIVTGNEVDVAGSKCDFDGQNLKCDTGSGLVCMEKVSDDQTFPVAET